MSLVMNNVWTRLHFVLQIFSGLLNISCLRSGFIASAPEILTGSKRWHVKESSGYQAILQPPQQACFCLVVLILQQPYPFPWICRRVPIRCSKGRSRNTEDFSDLLTKVTKPLECMPKVAEHTLVLSLATP